MRFARHNQQGDDGEKSKTWQPNTHEPPKDFECIQCHGGGFIPICWVGARGVAQIMSATCTCEAGRYWEEVLDYPQTTVSGATEPFPAKYMPYGKAKSLGLLDHSAVAHRHHWIHAKLAEARHDMIRTQSEDDWKVRYLECSKTIIDEENISPLIEAWKTSNPSPQPKQEIKGFKTPKQEESHT